jgi:hypothetical protein
MQTQYGNLLRYTPENSQVPKYNTEKYQNYGTMNQLMQYAPERELPDPSEYAPGEKSLSAYNALADLVLNHNSELQKIPLASSAATVQQYIDKYLTKNGKTHYEARVTDLNGDRVDDVIIWNKKSQMPYSINGYKLKSSDWGARDIYLKSHPDPESRRDESFSSWNTGSNYYDIAPDPEAPNNIFRRKVTLKSQYEPLRKQGWRLPKRPTNKLTPYAIFCQIIKPFIEQNKEAYIVNFLNNLVKTETAAGRHSAELFNRIVSPISTYRLLYNKMVLREYYYCLLDHKKETNVNNYEDFKVFMKYNPDRLRDFFVTNYLEHDARGQVIQPFRANTKVINANTVGGNLTHEDIQADGSDMDDIYVYMLGLNNINAVDKDDQGNVLPVNRLLLILCNNDETSNPDFNAKEFLYWLNYKESSYDSAEVRQQGRNNRNKCRKVLDRLKKDSENSIKILLKDKVQQFFDNDIAKERRYNYVFKGLNPISGNNDTAQQEYNEHGEVEGFKPN